MSDAICLLTAVAILSAHTGALARERDVPAAPALESPAIQWTRGIYFADLSTQAQIPLSVSPFDNLPAPLGWGNYLKTGACVAAAVGAIATNNGQRGMICDGGGWKLHLPPESRLQHHPD